MQTSMYLYLPFDVTMIDFVVPKFQWLLTKLEIMILKTGACA